MIRLSSPESVLNKLTEIQEKIDDLYETVRLVHELKDRIAASREEGAGHVTALKTQVDFFAELAPTYEKTVQELDEIHGRFEAELSRLLSDYEQEKAGWRQSLSELDAERETARRETADMRARVSDALAALHAQKAEIDGVLDAESAYREGLERYREKIVALEEEIHAKMADVGRMEAAGKEMVRGLGETQSRSDAALARMLSDFGWDRDDLRRAVRDLEARHDDLARRTHEINAEIYQTGRDVTERAAYDQRRTDDALTHSRRETDRMIAESRSLIAEELDRISRAAAGLEEDLRHGFDGETAAQVKWLRAAAARKFRDLVKGQQNYQAATSADLDARFSEETGKLGALAEREMKRLNDGFSGEKARIDQAMAMLSVKEADIDRLLELERDFRDGLNAYSEDVTRLTDRTAAKIAELEHMGVTCVNAVRLLDDFGKRADAEFVRILTEFAHEKAGVRQALDAFAAERLEIQKQQHRINQNMAQSEREITSRMAYFSKKLDRVVAETRLRAVQAFDEEKRATRSELAALMRDLRRTREEAAHLTASELDAVNKRLSMGLRHHIRRLTEQQNDFRRTAADELQRRFSEEKMALRERVRSFISGGERELQGLKDEVNAVKDRFDAGMEKEIDALHRRQTGFQQKAEQQMEARMAALHAALDKEVSAFIAYSRKEVSGYGEKAKQQIQERIDRLSAAAGENRKDLRAMQDMLSAFGDKLRGRLEKDVREVEDRQRTAEEKQGATLQKMLNILKAFEKRIVTMEKELTPRRGKN